MEETKNTPETSSANETPVIPEVIAQPHSRKQDDETVTLSKDAFDEMMKRLKKVEDDALLRAQVDDRNTAAKIESLRKEGKIIKSVKVRKIDGKYVLRFKTLEDEVYISDGKLHEKQTVELTFDDESVRVLPMRQWAGISEYVPFDVISESRDQEGDLFFKVKNVEGKELEINVKYVN